MLSSSTEKEGTTADARSAKSWTDSLTNGLSTSSSPGTCRGAMGIDCSPCTPSDCLLVASTRTRSALRRSWSTSSAHAPRRCSHESITRRASRRPSHSVRASASGLADWSAMPSAALTACWTMVGSCSRDRSTYQTPSGNCEPTWWATRRAVRDLPTPPMPVTVTRREPWRRCLMVASSRSLPTKLVSSAGRFPSLRHPAGVAMGRLTGVVPACYLPPHRTCAGRYLSLCRRCTPEMWAPGVTAPGTTPDITFEG